MFCPNCGNNVGNEDFCKKCGASLDNPSTRRFCAECGSPLDYGSERCSQCGAEVESVYKQENENVRSRGIEQQSKQTQPTAPKKKGGKRLAVGIAAAVVVAAAAVIVVLRMGGGEGSDTQFAEAPPENVYHDGGAIKIMTKAFNQKQASSDSSVLKELETYVGEDLEIEWTPDTKYDSSVNGIIGSGDYPHVMLVGSKGSAFVQAARSDMFWDISEAFDNPEKYPNLAQADPNVNHNISVDGKIYGIYRARELGRAGITIRKDWLDRLGLDIPETIDEFSEVLKEFTENDPDGNGVNDTYGMVITNYLSGPLDNIAVWMGAPNGWGVDDETDELKPSFMFEEYKDALKLMRDWYKAGYINQDMNTMTADKWNEPFLNQKAGVIIDVADRSRRLAQDIAPINPNAVVDVFGYVTKDAGSEPRTLPTNGYNGFYVFPKSTIKTHDDLEHILTVMDKLNDKTAVDLMNFGIEGVQYTVDANNYVTITSNKELLDDISDLNQISMGIITFPDGLKTKYTVPVAEKVDKVYEKNRQYAISNLAEPYISETYTKNGPVLDDIVNTAKMNFIIGKISEEEYDKEVERWKREGGDNYIREVNEEYSKDISVKQ